MERSDDTIHKGGCLCGAVRYEVVGKPVIVAHCHCEHCQRGSGAGHSTGAMFPVSRFSIQGAVSEYVIPSEDGNAVVRVFCPRCGSPIFGRNTVTTGHVTISLGTLDDSSDLAPEVVVFASNRKPWDVMDESLMTFETEPKWTPPPDDR
jgi:hypothetical protein